MSGEAVHYHGVRRDYTGQNLDAVALSADPIGAFQAWLQVALAPDNEGADANVMALATADTDGLPDVRYVLLKEVREQALVFFSDSGSSKGRQLAANPYAAAAFHWRRQDRQIRVRGPVSVLPAAVADLYWDSRPAGSRQSAAASNQSQAITHRDEVLAARAAVIAAHGEAVPRPERWVGYGLAIDVIEFWQGQPDRCHDRLVCERQSDGGWGATRLAP